MTKLDLDRLFFPLVALLALISGGVSLLIGLGVSVWFDEAYSVLVAEHSWREIISLTVVDVHPPMYYWLLKGWASLFGFSELALRGMSVVFLMLAVVVSGLLLRKIFSAKTALLALPFVALAPFLLRYGFEIRMYALASLIGIAATYVLVLTAGEAVRRRRMVLLGAYSLLVALGVYTLYFMALVWIAHLAWLVWLAIRERRRSLLVQGCVAYGFSFLIFLPWLLLFLTTSAGGTDTLSPVTHRLDIDGLVGIVTFMFLYQPQWRVGMIALAAVMAALVAYLARFAWRVAEPNERRGLLLFTFSFMVPVAVLVVVTQFLPIYLERYIAHFVVGGYMGVGAVAALALQRGGLWPRIAAASLMGALLVGCVSLAQFGNYNFQRLHTPSTKQAAALLVSCKDGTPIFADGPQVAIELGFYVKDCPVYFFNETLEMSGGFAMLSGSPLRVADARAEFKNEDKLLYVYYDEPKRALPAGLSQVGDVEFESLHVATYERTGVH